MQVQGKMVERKVGTFENGKGETVAYDHVLVADGDVPVLPGVEFVNTTHARRTITPAAIARKSAP